MALGVTMKSWCSVFLVSACCMLVMADDCDVAIGNHLYIEETLISGVQGPQGMAVDSSTNSLYFTFYNGSWNNVKLDLRSKAFSVIKELSGSCMFSVDQARGRVYAGCQTLYDAPGGLYEQDSDTGLFALAGEAGRNVKFVHYYNDKLYYSYFPGHLLHTLTSAHSVHQSDPAWVVRGLVVSGQGDYVFKNRTGVYRRLGDGTEEMLFNRWVWALAVDNGGTAYTCSPITPRGVWRLNDQHTYPVRLLNVECLGLTFAGGDIIYGDRRHDRIVRLVKC